MPSLWNPYRANRFRRSEGASHQKIEATDRAGLSVHAGQSRGCAARGESGQGPFGPNMRSSRSGFSKRPKRRPRYLGADEIQRGKGQRYWTVLSGLVHGEVIGLARDRSQESLSGLLKQHLDNRQRASVEAVCIDMHQPYVNAFSEVLPKAEVVYDKFHVLRHAAEALDEVRRQEFFRAGEVMRE